MSWCEENGIFQARLVSSLYEMGFLDKEHSEEPTLEQMGDALDKLYGAGNVNVILGKCQPRVQSRLYAICITMEAWQPKMMLRIHDTIKVDDSGSSENDSSVDFHDDDVPFSYAIPKPVKIEKGRPSDGSDLSEEDAPKPASDRSKTSSESSS